MSSIKKSNVQTKIDIPRDLNPEQRELLARKVVQKIKDRTREGISASGRPFKSYSKAYTDSFDFKIAGKSSTVDLSLTGDMVADLDVISLTDSHIVVGYEMDYEDIGKVHGNVTGEYGNTIPVTSRRDFIGLPKKWVEILAEETRQEIPSLQSETDTAVASILSRLGVI